MNSYLSGQIRSKSTDYVCRTCMRIIEGNEVAVSINDTDLRDKLQICLPELVLDNVVDPKMCGTCSAALSLSFRFKGMCYEAEKTINNCLQNKTMDGSVEPLDDDELLSLGRRDIGDIIIGEQVNFDIAEEVEIESSAAPHQYLEPLQMLSDVASQATKAVASCSNSPTGSVDLKTSSHVSHNWEDEISGVCIERNSTVKNCVPTNIHASPGKKEINLPSKLKNKSPIKMENNVKKLIQKSVKVVVEATPVIDIVDKSVSCSPKTPKRVSFTPTTIKRHSRSGKKARRGTRRQKFVHKTGEDDLVHEKNIQETIVEPLANEAGKSKKEPEVKVQLKQSPVKIKQETEVKEIKTDKKVVKSANVSDTKLIVPMPIKATTSKIVGNPKTINESPKSTVKIEKKIYKSPGQTNSLDIKLSEIPKTVPAKALNIKTQIQPNVTESPVKTMAVATKTVSKSPIKISQLNQKIIIQEIEKANNMFVKSLNKQKAIKQAEPCETIKKTNETPEQKTSLKNSKKVDQQPTPKKSVTEKTENTNIHDSKMTRSESRQIEMIRKKSELEHLKTKAIVTPKTLKAKEIQKALNMSQTKKDIEIHKVEVIKPAPESTRKKLNNVNETRLTPKRKETKSQSQIQNATESEKILVKIAPKHKTIDKEIERVMPKTKRNKTESKSSNKPTINTTPVKVEDDLAKAFQQLLQTPEYQKLLQLQAKSEQTEKVVEKLQQLEKTLEETKIKSVPPSHDNDRKSVVEIETKKSPRLRSKSRRTKAIEEINLDLAEINNGVEQQNCSASSTHIELDTPIKVDVIEAISKTEDILQDEEMPVPQEVEKKEVWRGKKRVSYAIRAIRRRQYIREAKMRGKVFYVRKEIDGRSFKKKQPPQVCTVCGKVYKHISHLEIHMRSHVLLKSFGCDLCGKTFSLERYLILHTNQHFTAGDHQCTICEKYFSSTHVLKKHELIHTGEKPHACELCDRRFTQKVNLEIHMRVHTGEREFLCFVCNAAFSQKVHLKSHMIVHTGEKPYKCHLCPKAFSKNAVLRTHTNLHACKPYKCDDCHRLFKDAQTLARHLKHYVNKNVHTKATCSGKIYNCGICSRYFISKFSRNRHMKVHVKDLIEGIRPT